MNSTFGKIFGTTAVGWALVSVIVCKFLSPTPALFFANLGWMLGLWFLSILDLVALGKTVQGLGVLPARILQTFYWGFLKLICIGLFAVVLVKGKSIPSLGLLMGLGTVGIVPLLGGFFWSRTADA